VAVGDHVVLTYMWCGHCRPCLRGDLTYCEHFYALNFGGAREATVLQLIGQMMPRNRFAITFLGNHHLAHLHWYMNAM